MSLSPCQAPSPTPVYLFKVFLELCMHWKWFTRSLILIWVQQLFVTFFQTLPEKKRDCLNEYILCFCEVRSTVSRLFLKPHFFFCTKNEWCFRSQMSILVICASNWIFFLGSFGSHREPWKYTSDLRDKAVICGCHVFNSNSYFLGIVSPRATSTPVLKHLSCSVSQKLT